MRELGIGLQMQLYGWLFEQTVGIKPLRLEVHCGSGDLVQVPYDGGQPLSPK